MILKPQDILVLLKLVAIGDQPWSYNSLAVELGMSPSEVHAAIKRALQARLAVKIGDRVEPQRRNLEEFLAHGLPYVFIPEPGALTRGMPTAHAAPPLLGEFVATDEPPLVWPDPEGNERGQALTPLYKSAPFAAKRDAKLYQLLAVVDAIRHGRARERKLGEKYLKEALAAHG